MAISHPLRSFAVALSTPVRDSFAACGIRSGQPWWMRLFLVFFIVPRAANQEMSRKQRLALYFPHIDFDQLRIADLVRIPVQIVWLLLVRPSIATGKCGSAQIR